MPNRLGTNLESGMKNAMYNTWNQKGFFQLKFIRKSLKDYIDDGVLKVLPRREDLTEFDQEVMLNALAKSYTIRKGEPYVNITSNREGFPQVFHISLEVYALCERHGITWRL